MKVCKECGSEFTKHSAYANHIRWKHTQSNRQNLSAAVAKGNTTRYGEWITDTIKCGKDACQNYCTVKYREKIGPKEKYFCGRSCANSRGVRTEEFKKAVSIRIKEQWTKGTYDNIEYSNNKMFTSLAERNILDYFKKEFPNDEWTSGGSIKHNEIRLVRDMYSNKLKVCFEYDGIWHFKDIHGQLIDKKKKDTALEEWCIKNKYRLVRVQEGFFSNFEQIRKLIYEDDQALIKIGSGY